jgi:hypothetical protein
MSCLLYVLDICFACFSIRALHRGCPTTSQATCSAMNKSAAKSKREVAVMEGKEMRLGRVIRFCRQTTARFSASSLHNLCTEQSQLVSPRHSSPVLYRHHWQNYRPSETEELHRVKYSYTEWSTVRIKYFGRECCYKSVCISREKRNWSQNLSHKLSILTRGSKLYVSSIFQFRFNV